MNTKTRGWKIARRVALGILVAGFLYFAVTFVQVWWAARHDHARRSDAIIVLGAAQYDGRPSAVLRARLDHAADLWQRKIAPVIVVTGGKAVGDRFTESQAGANYLHGKGVPDEAILREATGRSSWESLSSAARFLHQRGIKDVVLVSDPFHAARIHGIAAELGLSSATSPTRTSPIKGLSEFRHMVTETAQVGLARVIGFRRLVRVEHRFALAQHPA